ncbi:MAG: aminotransferase class I/II-fold pyridoxal phosphate-dependent enzyme [bacterium]|nr:aminotransferase class I/II-fold pyridoxal phosphate-dependent enzyme [bacterium]
MSKSDFEKILQGEIARIDDAKTSKRNERVIEGFTAEHKAIIGGKEYSVFNSNDYLGLRHNEKVKRAEAEAGEKYGAGPGAVRFISGTMQVHKDLEERIASFHAREAAILFSSAFAVNMAVIHCFLKGQSKDSLVSNDVLVVSDALNHRSIIDGVRVAGLEKHQKAIFEHMNLDDLNRVLAENIGKFRRVVVVSDGVFSMLGEYQDLKKMQEVCDKYDGEYPEGVITIVDDAHGVAAFGESGRGTEEITGGRADVLVGTFGKGFGSDGGYVVADKIYVDYLRESAATYIYSNPFSPGTAGAALAAVNLIDSDEGKNLIEKSRANISLFKERALNGGLKFVTDSRHPIQPILVGDSAKARALADKLFENGILATSISYPVVPKGNDEIRVQISALHSPDELEKLVSSF